MKLIFHPKLAVPTNRLLLTKYYTNLKRLLYIGDELSPEQYNLYHQALCESVILHKVGKGIVALLVVMLIGGCSSVPKQPSEVDINPARATIVAHHQTFSGAGPGLVVTPPTNFKLTWDYSETLPAVGVGFNIETTPDINYPSWTLYCTTNQPPVYIDATNAASYFRVGSFVELPL